MNEIKRPEKVSSYFKAEWKSLLLVTISGIIYNVGLIAGPFFEGKLVQCLIDILKEKKQFSDMMYLTAAYLIIIIVVQGARYLKRLYVRQFANHTNLSMKHLIYGNLVHKPTAELKKENVGSVMTKVVSDVDACVEGMRKFATEIFDTGVALAGYAGMLFVYDWQLALLCLVFPPVSYLIAEKMKVVVQNTGAAYKESAERLNEMTLDRVSGAITYRVFGVEGKRDNSYEKYLGDYETKAVKANIWVSALPPIYQVVSMSGVIFILYLGERNVLGQGFALWDIAAFTTFLSVYTKLSVKSSKAAKLFNAVQKAQVSWKRIQPYLKEVPKEKDVSTEPATSMVVTDLGVKDSCGDWIFHNLSFQAEPGQIIGVTGPIACGKSILGKAFLCEESYSGSIKIGEEELSEIEGKKRVGMIGYVGHESELLSDSVRSNVLMGKEDDVRQYLEMVCLDEEVMEMPDGVDTVIGSNGVLLSGGQRQRMALARTLAHRKPVMILDDPFSALDKTTEFEIFYNLKNFSKESIVILISHRLYLFPLLDGVIWMENGNASLSKHSDLIEKNPLYTKLYYAQQEGGAKIAK